MKNHTQFTYIILLLLLEVLFNQHLWAQNKPANTTRPSATAVAVPAAYPSASLNIVRTWAPRMRTTDPATVTSATRTTAEVMQTTGYFDGLGRNIQNVTKRISPLGRDLVKATIYDSIGHVRYDYLPFVPTAGNNADGLFKTDPFNSQKNFYQDASLNPGVQGESIFYSQNEYERSPLNRILKRYGAGNTWAQSGGGHPLETRLLATTVSDSVRYWIMGPVTATSTTTFAARELNKRVSIDESGKQLIEYINKENQVVLRKVQYIANPGSAHIGWMCTYYVYDLLGNLRFVIPPKATEEAMRANWILSAQVISELCYLYRYDGRNRKIVYKAPGADSIDYVYDKRDRLVMLQDGSFRGWGIWRAFYYDNQDRERMQGMFYYSATRAQMQSNMDAAAINESNSIPFISESNVITLGYTFYDNYNFTGKANFDATDIAKVQTGANPYSDAIPATPSVMTRGLITGRRLRVERDEEFLTTTYYYDNKGRVIQSIEDNIAGGKLTTNNLYDFSDQLLSTYERCTNPKSTTTPNLTVLMMMDYDAAGRLDSIKMKINDNMAWQGIIAVNSYDELGRLKIKRLGVSGSTSQLETRTMEYNIREWLKSINKGYVNTAGSSSNWFGQELCYDWGFDSTEFNSNIAGIKWKSGSDGIARAYGYDYDIAKRLVAADFTQQNDGSTSWTRDKADFSVSGLSYDINGNILTMKQRGMEGASIKTIDSLKYGYLTISNRLNFVTDKRNNPQSQLGDFKESINSETQDYFYNKNGSMSKDKNKGLDSIHYNHFGLPATFVLNGRGMLFYQYDGAGKKLSKIVVDTTIGAYVDVTYYIGRFIFKNDTLQYIAHPEGRTVPIFKTGRPLSFSNEYFVEDYQRNIRTVLQNRTDTSQYAATMETAASGVENALFSNIDNTRSAKPSGYPTDNTTSPNEYVARLNAVNGQKIGPSLVLRVMTGDTIQAGVKGFYKSTAAATSATPVANMVSSLLQAFVGPGLLDGVHTGTGTNAPITVFNSSIYDQLKQQDPNQNLSDKPKAYLSYVLFDEQFNLVSTNSGIKQLQGAANSLQTLATSRFVIKKTGFLYIYTSNESAEDVYFDNLVVVHNTGPLVNSTHYYPFGLTMASISSNALKGDLYRQNRLLFGGKEQQTEEFRDGSSIHWYDFGARMYDNQIARWHVPDPLAEKMRRFTPYNYAFNNPVKFADPDGMKAYGDYYTMAGTYLGSDGKNDDKVYAVKDGGVIKTDRSSKSGHTTNIIKNSAIVDLGVSHKTLLAFASAVHQESGGAKEESFAVASVMANFVKEGRATQLKTLEHITRYKNTLVRGATQGHLNEFLALTTIERNSKFAMAAAINAVGHMKELGPEFNDATNGADSWDGIDLVDSDNKNNHRSYRWNAESATLLEQYRKRFNGGVDVSSFKYTKSNYQISATAIIGKTLFTNLEGGRGEHFNVKKGEDPVEFKFPW